MFSKALVSIRRKPNEPDLDALVEQYQHSLDGVLKSVQNLGIHGRVNATLVVAGPKEEIDRFEAVAASRRLFRVAVDLQGLREPTPEHWRIRPPLSLRSLLQFVPPSQRQRFRRELPRETSVELVSRLETVEGRVRVEYRFGILRGRSVVERLLRSVSAVRTALSFVLVAIDRELTDVGLSLIAGSHLERSRLSRTRCRALVRSQYREWRGDEGIALDQATSVVLSEGAAHWDVYLGTESESVAWS